MLYQRVRKKKNKVCPLKISFFPPKIGTYIYHHLKLDQKTLKKAIRKKVNYRVGIQGHSRWTSQSRPEEKKQAPPWQKECQKSIRAAHR